MNKQCFGLSMSLLAGVTLAGCVEVDAIRFVGSPTYPATDAAHVQMLQKFPDQPYVRLGELLIPPDEFDWPTEDLDAALRKHGARMGADAVVVVFDHVTRAGYQWSDWDVQPYYGHMVRAVAIKMGAEPAATPTAAEADARRLAYRPTLAPPGRTAP